MNNIRPCRDCGKLFNDLGRGYCPACLEKQEEDLKKVKEYMWDNKGATVQELSENCNVDAKLIMQWLRKERIQLASESGIELFCETCGNKILTGRYCDKCKLDTQNRLAEISNKQTQITRRPAPVSSGAKMRFINK